MTDHVCNCPHCQGGGWITVPQMAAHMRVNQRTIQRWAREKRIPHLRVKGKIMFTVDQLRQVEAAYAVEPQQRHAVDEPNPRYQPHIVVVPMARQPPESRSA